MTYINNTYMYMENDRLFFTDVVLITQLRNEKANVGIVFTNSMRSPFEVLYTLGVPPWEKLDPPPPWKMLDPLQNLEKW